MEYVLVTGCNGFIGEQVVRNLTDNGVSVLGVSKAEKCLFNAKNFIYSSIELTNSFAIEKLFRDYDIVKVIHLAAIAHKVKGVSVDWSEYFRVNTLASRTIFECSFNVGAKVFFSSTVDVYGNYDGTIINEDTATIPVSDYGKSKLYAEEYLQTLYKEKESEYFIARFAPVYSSENKKDVFKRIYLRYPKIALLVNEGISYDFGQNRGSLSIQLQILQM